MTQYDRYSQKGLSLLQQNINIYVQETITYKCMDKRRLVVCLEAFPVDNGGAGLIVFLLADPHLLEGGQRSQDGATDPDGVLSLRWSNDLRGE